MLDFICEGWTYELQRLEAFFVVNPPHAALHRPTRLLRVPADPIFMSSFRFEMFDNLPASKSNMWSHHPRTYMSMYCDWQWQWQ